MLGSGIMGSRIACHFANAGVEVLLLDIIPKELNAAEKKAGLDEKSPAFRNRIVDDSLKQTLKASPAALYHKSFARRIRTGNFQDDMKYVADCDWIIEAVIENLDIKKSVFSELEKFRRAGTLVTSNTSGIPIRLMAEGRSDDFRKNFCGTHFFNPPRYLRLLELIPGPETDAEVLEFLALYADLHLGKTVVPCKDTPAFIANRIGVYSIMSLFHHVEKMGLSVEEVDKLTGPVLGRPKSATFRTCDVVGLDTLVKVANDVYERCPNDESRDTFVLPGFVKKLMEKGWFGDKTKQGFYKKVKDEKGKSEILSLDLETLEYKEKSKIKIPLLDQVKNVDAYSDRIKIMLSGNDKASEFYRASFAAVFAYIANRIPEIADTPHEIDEALSAGFGWEFGPFSTWDMIGFEKGIKLIESHGHKIAEWLLEMRDKGVGNFYQNVKGLRQYYHPAKKAYENMPGAGRIILLDSLADKVVWKNSGSSLIDIGDGVINLEFHTKMNTIGGEIIEGVNKAIQIAEKDFKGLVIGNQAQNFSAGANLAMIFMFATEQEFDEIDLAVRAFQNMNMRIRYSSVPVVVAPHGLTLGGGCEMSLHADKVVASAETYIGLVEFGVGLIPGGGGSKEMTLRASDAYLDGGIDVHVLKEYYLNIAMAKVSTSAHEAFDLHIFRDGLDQVVVNPTHVISEAKTAVLELADNGYSTPVQRRDIKVLGRNALGMFFAGANAMSSGRFISSHDKLISEKLAYIMCGGDLSSESQVSEQYLLDLEREAFLSLCGERKTLERIQSILTTGKPLRN